LSGWIGACLRANASSGARIDPKRRTIPLRRPAPGLWPWDPVDAGVLRLDDLDAIDLRTVTVGSTGYRYRNAVLGMVVPGGPRLQPVSHPDEAPALRPARQLQQPLGLRLRDRRLHRTS
jgi:hypothetical protein